MDSTLIYILLAIHALACLVYLFVFFKWGEITAYIFPFVVFMPYLWMVFFLLGYAFIYLVEKNVLLDKTGLIMQEEDMDLLERGVNIEKNIIPVEEALILNDNEIKRDTVIEIAKRDPSKYLDQLKIALLSSDSETAHYAASSISKLKRNIDKNVTDLKTAYINNPADIKNREEYISMLQFAIDSNLSVDVISRKLIEELIDVLRYHIIITKNAKEEYYEMLIDYMTDIKDYKNAKTWADRYESDYPESEEPLVKKLNIYFMDKDEKEFGATIKKLETAKFPVSNETWEMIRFWRSEI